MKIYNNPEKVADEAVEGFLRAHRNDYKRIGDFNAVARKETPIEDKVAILIGGGDNMNFDMAGFSITLFKLNDRFKTLYDAEAESPGYKA
jgi:dihydroxyacetone kinase